MVNNLELHLFPLQLLYLIKRKEYIKMNNEKLECLFNQLNNIIIDLSSVRLEYETNIEYGETEKEEKQMDHLSEIIEIEQKIRNIEHNLYFDTYERDRKSTRLNSSHVSISYAVFCLKKKKTKKQKI